MRLGTSIRWTAISVALMVAAASLQGCGDEGSGDDSAAKEGASQGAQKVSKEQKHWDDIPVPPENGPRLVSIALATVVYEAPSKSAAKIGYLRVGATVPRSPEPVSTVGCEGGWYKIRPAGFVCVGQKASTYLRHPIARALGRQPRLDKPMPYSYAFVRATAPNYLRIPTRKEQHMYEFMLDRHLRSYRRLHTKWNRYPVGANDVPLDQHGVATGPPPKEPPKLTENALFGGHGDDMIPWWLDGGRKIPHLSGYRGPSYAVIAGRVRRHTGLALIDTFVPGESAGYRRMAVTTDGRMVPASKLKPNRGSTWHGVALGGPKRWHLPLCFVKRPKGAPMFDLSRPGLEPVGTIPWRSVVQLTGRVRMRKEVRLVETQQGMWIRSADVATAALPKQLPFYARGTTKWIDLSIVQQILVAWEGRKPVYVTMVSTGRDGLGDPATTHSTIQGTFRIREKHVTTTMDSNEVDNQFELRDVPWVQYFKGGYALHAAYWHDDYGKPRSHGCVNMSPIDARWLFFWTDPVLPKGWHGVYANRLTQKGTIVYIHP